MKTIIKVNGRWYNLVDMFGGKVFLSELFNINNDIAEEGVLWEMQPIFFEKDIWYATPFKQCIIRIRWLLKLIK